MADLAFIFFVGNSIVRYGEARTVSIATDAARFPHHILRYWLLSVILPRGTMGSVYGRLLEKE